MSFSKLRIFQNFNFIQISVDNILIWLYFKQQSNHSVYSLKTKQTKKSLSKKKKTRVFSNTMKIFFILFNSYVHLNPIIHPLHSRWRTGHLGETLVLEQAIFFSCVRNRFESFSCLMNILGSVKERSDGAEYGARGCFSHIHLFQFLMN